MRKTSTTKLIKIKVYLMILLTLGAAGAAPAQESPPPAEPSCAAGRAFLVVKPGSLKPADAAVVNRLEALGFEVDVEPANRAQAADADGKDLVVISSTVNPRQVSAEFRDVTVAVVTWESGLFDDLGMTGSARDVDFGEVAGQTAIDVIEPQHPLAAGLSGTVIVATPGDGDSEDSDDDSDSEDSDDDSDSSFRFGWGAPNADAFSVATISGDPAKSTIFGYEAGAAMPDLAAPARRVGLFFDDETALHLTAAGAALFDAAIAWAANLDVTPPSLTLSPPGEPVVFTPVVDLEYADDGCGIDLESLRIELDGEAITLGCLVEADSASCDFFGLEDGPYTVSAEIRDLAGNAAAASVTFEVVSDEEPPAIAITAPTDGGITTAAAIEVTGTASDDVSVEEVEVNGSPAVFAAGVFSAQVPLSEGLNTLVAVARDSTGKRGSAVVRLARDTEPPQITIEAPAAGELTNAPSVRFTGRADDLNGVAAVEVDGAAVELADGAFEQLVSVAEGLNQIAVRAVDVVGNANELVVEVRRRTVPALTLTAPPDLALVTAEEVTVEGTVSDPDATVMVNGTPAVVSGTDFFAAGIPISPGGNLITAVATSADGSQATAKVKLFRDLTPPRVVIYDPADGAVVSEPVVPVRGLVNDLVLGTVNGEQATVTVDGVSAAVANRGFLVAGVLLEPGENLLTAAAVDASGNAAESSVRVTFEPPAGPVIQVQSGNLQTAAIGEELAQPLVARLDDGFGNPVAGRPVVFRVSDGNGRLEGVQRQVAIVTGADGLAAVSFTLGTRAGAGTQRVEATAAGSAGRVVFTASATPGPAAVVLTDSGDQQVGATGQVLPDALVAVVTDASFNRLEGVPVTFRTVLGDGVSIDGDSVEGGEVTVVSDSDGRASVRFRLDPAEGVSNNAVEASIASDAAAPMARFAASGRAADDPALTSISGLVLDNTDLPIPGVRVHLAGTTFATATDAAGLFSISGAPVGTVLLEVDGTTAQRPGTWPSLEFELTTVPGRDNTLGRPIYLLPLDVDNGLWVSETEGGVLTLPQIPGFALEIAPGSVTFPDGGRSGVVSVTPVHSDKVPMVPNFGQQPRLIVTIQPAGAIFDPPARLTLPNVDGLEPGEATEFYSFDHDLNRFVSIGPGAASEDGTVLATDPGVGVVKAGWHCGSLPPGFSGTPHDCEACTFCAGTVCQRDRDQDGDECALCRDCQFGVCVPTLKRPTITEPPDNPKPLDAAFLTNLEILSNGAISARATLPPETDPSQILWSVTVVGEHGIKDETPADRSGPSFSFTPDVPANVYEGGTGCRKDGKDPRGGSCERSKALSYEITATFCGRSGESHRIKQDQRDIIIQEYVNHGFSSGNIPKRLTDFRVPEDIRDSDGNILFSTKEILTRDNPYSFVLGTPGKMAKTIRDEFNRRILDDDQPFPVGTVGLLPMAAVVLPGRDIQTIGAILDTLPCDGAPDPFFCDDQLVPCDDFLSADGRLEPDPPACNFLRLPDCALSIPFEDDCGEDFAVIVAGDNGIAETQAVNRITNAPFIISSGWRNPERNEAFNGEQRSQHLFGTAVDLEFLISFNYLLETGKTRRQLYCILQTAADEARNAQGEKDFNGFAEKGPNQVSCDALIVSHVHAQTK